MLCTRPTEDAEVRRVTGGRGVVRRLAALTALAFAALLPIAGPAAAAGPEWKLTVTPSADYFLSTPGVQHYGVYKIEAENVGTAPTQKEDPITHAPTPIVLEDVPPPGTTAEEVAFFNQKSGVSTNFARSPYGVCPSNLVCRWPEGPLAGSLPALARHQKFSMFVLLAIPSGLEGTLEDVAKISGGGAPPAEARASNVASSDPLFGKLGFAASLTDSAGDPYTQAAGHPYQFTTEFDFATYSSIESKDDSGNPSSIPKWVDGTQPLHDPREIVSALPPGLLANPQGVPRCALAEYYASECPVKTQVGLIAIRLFGYTEDPVHAFLPLYNLQPAGAYPGQLGATIAALPIILINAGLRSGSDYGVTATNVAAEAGVTRVRVTLWGVPAAHAHDAARGGECAQAGPELRSVEEFERRCEEGAGVSGFGFPGGPAGVEPTPFLTMPTECSGKELPILGRYNSWEFPGEFAKAATAFPAVDGCNQLKFEPTIEARPTTNLADFPSGFDFNLKVPQHETIDEPATPDLKEAVVKLPPGLVVNPSSGAGLEGCSPAQIGLTTPVATVPAHFTESPAQCPDASKLGDVEVNTPLLHEPLGGIPPIPGHVGAVYLATPHQNPSGGLLAGYIVLEGEGLVIKLAGQFQTDPQTGQITAGFTENPQTPFEEFKFHFFEGARGALRTPAVCGTYQVTSQLTPYSHIERNAEGEEQEATPIAEPASEFETTQGPQGEGSPCPNSASEEPHKPIFRAGTESPQAGKYSPFSLKLVREDGSQELKGIDTTLPPGLIGKLAGIAECSDAALATAAGKSGQAEQASPSCPLGSEVGTVDVAAGAGPTPLNVSGKAYLAGPYKSAPLSLAIITPAVAGPFDLGTVVVRTALYVNPETAQIHATSDPIPTILEGIPLDVRSITLKTARPNFTLNPTNCEPLSFTGSALSALGSVAPLSQRFQVGGCKVLPFKPQLKLSLKGKTNRTGHPALKAVLTAKPGEANIAAAQVTLPHSAFLEQGHIRTICTRVQFAANACPAGAIYGKATAVTPLLDKPLSGPVYLRSSSRQLPDLVADLNGQIHVVLDGHVDSVNARLRNSFEAVPDAPVSKFVLEMQGGKKGLIVNSENLCSKKAKAKAIVAFTGQNGKTYNTEPTVANSCGKKGKKKGKGKHPSHRVGTTHR